MINNGKRFEDNIRKSVPEDYFYYRLRDNQNNWNRGTGIRFAITNMCDCIVFNGEYLLLMELKNTKGKSLPFDRIRKNQLEELLLQEYKLNCKPCLLINFEELEECYYMPIQLIDELIRKNERKSISIEECRLFGLRVESKKLRTNSKYNIKKLFEDIKELG